MPWRAGLALLLVLALGGLGRAWPFGHTAWAEGSGVEAAPSTQPAASPAPAQDATQAAEIAPTTEPAPPPAAIKETVQQDDAAPPVAFTSSKNIEDKLQEARQDRKGLFNFGLRDLAVAVDQKLYAATRIRFAGMYTAVYQRASTGNGPRDASGGDLDVIATWDALRRGDRTTGAVEVALEARHGFGGEITPSALSTTIDSLWSTISGFNVQTFFPVQFYWRQDLLNNRLHIRVGKVSGYSTFFGNRINSSSLYFMNYAFSDNPAVFFPGNGLGLHATWDFSKRWSASFGIQNANGVKTEFDPSTLELGEFWFAGQVNLRTRIRGLGEGTYRLGTWWVMARDENDAPPGAGTVLSIDQELGKKVIGFLRYEYQGQDLLTPEVEFEALTATRSALRLGVGITGFFKRLPDDYMGVALAWGDPADSLAKDTAIGEVFYRLQLESASHLTASLQVIRSSTVFDTVYVLGLRYRIEF